MAKKIDDFCGVGDVVELGANYFNHHTSANLVADPTHPLHKPNRYKGLPTEYYANGGTLWPLSGPVKSGWKKSNFVVRKGLIGQVVHIWQENEGGFPGYPALRILVQFEHEGEFMYVPVRRNAIKEVLVGQTIKPAKRES